MSPVRGAGPKGKGRGGTGSDRRARTTTDRLPELEAWVAEKHTYEVPEWITLPVTGGSAAYLSWVEEETHPA